MREIYLLLIAILAATVDTAVESQEASHELYTSSSKILKTITRIDNTRRLTGGVCDPYVLSVYMTPSSSSKFEPLDAELEKVSDFCPNIKTSCCTRNQIEYQIKYFKEAVEKIEMYEEFIKQMNQTIGKKSKNNRFHSVVEAYNIPLNLNCIGKLRAKNAELDLDEFLLNLPTATDRFRAIKEANIKYYSGFMCSFCNGENSQFFSNLDYQKTSNFILKYKFSNVKPALEIYSQFLDFMLYVIKLKNIVDIIDCGKGDRFLYMRVRSAAEYEAMKKQVTMCLSLSENYKEFVMHPDCKAYFAEPNVFDFSDDYQHIIEVYSRALTTISEFFRISKNISVSILSSDVTNSVEYFYRRVRSNTSWEKKITIDLDERNGIDMIESPFDPSVFKASGLCKAFAALMSLVALILS